MKFCTGGRYVGLTREDPVPAGRKKAMKYATIVERHEMLDVVKLSETAWRLKLWPYEIIQPFVRTFVPILMHRAGIRGGIVLQTHQR